MTKFSNSVVDDSVLCMCHAHRLPPSCLSWSKPAGVLRKKKVCVILETVLLQGLLPKGNMDKTTPMLAPSAYTDLSNIFPANFASSDNPTCL